MGTQPRPESQARMYSRHTRILSLRQFFLVVLLCQDSGKGLTRSGDYQSDIAPGELEKVGRGHPYVFPFHMDLVGCFHVLQAQKETEV